MALKLAVARYMFLFDPTKTWARLYQFETDLKLLLDAKGLDGVIVDTMGKAGEKIVYVRPKDKMNLSVAKPAKKGRPLSVKGRFKQMTPKKGDKAGARDFKKGKFLKRKGYLKRG